MTARKPTDQLTRFPYAVKLLDDFADLLAEGVHPEDAAVQLGHSRPYGRTMLVKLRRGLGWQAV